MRQGLSQGNPDKTVMPTCLGGSTAAIPTAELREGSGYGMMTLVEDQGGSREDKTTTTLKRSKGKKKKMIDFTTTTKATMGGLGWMVE
jgi:hypothetical protein